VTKFGVVALSEGLALELEQAGSQVCVTVLCPEPVRTNIKASSRNWPAGLADAGLQDVDIESDPDWQEARFLDPAEVGALVVRAIRRGDLHAIPHPEHLPWVQERHARIVQALEAASG
jgi:short-subunit dehydrogenase